MYWALCLSSLGVRPGCSTQSPLARVATRDKHKAPTLPLIRPLSLQDLIRSSTFIRGEGGEGWLGGPLDFAGECEKYAMVPIHRATARDRPYSRRSGKPTRPCIVGAGLAPALPRCTRSFIRQQSPLWSPAVLLSSPLQVQAAIG